jgi:hypothetical protein
MKGLAAVELTALFRYVAREAPHLVVALAWTVATDRLARSLTTRRI